MKRLLVVFLAFFLSNCTVLAMEEEWELIESPKEKITILLEDRRPLDVVDFNMFLKNVSKAFEGISNFIEFMPNADRLESVRVVDNNIAIIKQCMAVINNIFAKLFILNKWILTDNADVLHQGIKQETESNLNLVRGKGIQFNEQSIYPFLGLTLEQAGKMSYQEIKGAIDVKKRTVRNENDKLILRQIEYQLGNQFKKKEFDAYLKGIEGITELLNEYKQNVTSKIVAIQKYLNHVGKLREELAELENKLTERRKPLEIDEYLQKTEAYADNAAERIKKMERKSELEAERAVIKEKINQLGVYEKRKLTSLQKNALWGLRSQNLPTLLRLIEDKLIRVKK